MKKLAIALLMSACAFSAPVMAAKMTVYCVNGKIAVDMRDLKQMSSGRRGHVYAIKTFDYKLDADKLAASLGGVGAPCDKK